MRTIFAGSSGFGIPALEQLLRTEPPVLILSQPDKPAGRNLQVQACPLAHYARCLGSEVFCPPDINAPEVLERLRDLQPDLLITASYGGMLRRELRRIPTLGAINLHPSLLPLYRGATPIQSALLNGDARSGVTIFRLGACMDAGPILAQRELDIEPQDNFTTLQARLAELAASLLLELLPALQEGTVEARPQNESLATYTRKLQKQDLVLDWNQAARDVLNRIRAFSQTPGASTTRRGAILKILAAELHPQPAQNIPGTVAEIFSGRGFAVNCRDVQLLVTQVQPAGKKCLAAPEYLRGARVIPGESLGLDWHNASPHNPEQRKES